MDAGESDVESNDRDKLLGDGQGKTDEKRKLFTTTDSSEQFQSDSRLTRNKRCFIVGGLFGGVVILAILIGVIARTRGQTNGCDQFNTLTHDSSDSPNVSVDGQKFPYTATRLPLSLRPLQYNILLLPSIQHMNYTGQESITLRVENPVDYIVLHQRQLYISTIRVALTKHPKRQLKVVQVLKNTYNEYLYIKVNETMARHQFYTLKILFSGKVATNKLIGVYRSMYVSANGDQRVMISTDFEPADARSAFPCFDEPMFKSHFKLSIVRPSTGKWIALSNMPIESTTQLHNGYVQDNFANSTYMSTYLVAFVLCQFDSLKTNTSDGITVQTWSVPRQISKTEYALRVAREALSYYEQYFNVSYPLPKLDIVGIPFFSSSAMENWGLLFFKETSLLYDRTSDSTMARQAVSTTVCHELSHQWFGNLVTLKWWDNLWLNEGFATYMENIGVSYTNPEFQVMDQFPMTSTSHAMIMDGYGSTNPISVSVITVRQISSMFNAISYDKGASLLHMLHAYLGDLAFHKAIHNYLQDYKFSNADDNDLWKSFSAVIHNAFDVERMMNTWTKQAHFPVVTIKKLTRNRLEMTQQLYSINPTNDNSKIHPSVYGYKWVIPIKAISSNGRVYTHVLDMDNGSIATAENFRWIKGNFNQTGYYRVNYDAENWKNLEHQLNEKHKALNALDRFGLLDDSLALSKAGLLNGTTFLALTWYIDKERDYLPIKAALTGIIYMHSLLTKEADRKYAEEYFLHKIKPIYEYLGWVDDGSPLQQYLRSSILNALCGINYPDVVDRSKSLYKDWLSNPKAVPPNLVDVVLQCAMKQADEAAWNKMFTKYIKSQNPTKKQEYLSTLGVIRDRKLLYQLLQSSMKEDIIAIGDTISVITSVADNPLGTSMAWQFAVRHWKELTARYGATTFAMDHLINGITRNFRTKEELQKVKDFFHCQDGTSALPVISESIEKIEAKIYWRQLNEKHVAKWFKVASKE